MIEKVSFSDQIVWAGDVDRKCAMEKREQVLADDCDQVALPVNAVRRTQGEQVLLDVGQFMALQVLKGKLIPQTEHFAIDIESIVPGFVADDEIVSETKDLLLHSSILRHFFQECDAAGVHPFDNVNISVGIEAGVVWMDELAVLPAFWLLAHLETVENLFGPFWIVTKMHGDIVILIEDRHAGV